MPHDPHALKVLVGQICIYNGKWFDVYYGGSSWSLQQGSYEKGKRMGNGRWWIHPSHVQKILMGWVILYLWSSLQEKLMSFIHNGVNKCLMSWEKAYHWLIGLLVHLTCFILCNLCQSLLSNFQICIVFLLLDSHK